MKFRNHAGDPYRGHKKMIDVMQAWNGDEVVVKCRGFVSVVEENDQYYQKLQNGHVPPNRHSRLNRINSQKIRNYDDYTQPIKSRFNTNPVSEQYVFRARSPSPLNHHNQFAQIANQYSHSRKFSCTSRKNSQIREPIHNRSRSR